MRDDTFNEAYQLLLQMYQDEIIESQPHEVNKREYVYHKCQVLSDVVTELASLVNQGISTSARAAVEDIEDEEDQFDS